MAALLPQFVDGGNMAGLFLPAEHQATFRRLALEAKSIVDEELLHANDFSMAILSVVNAPTYGILDGPSHAGVNEVT